MKKTLKNNLWGKTDMVVMGKANYLRNEGLINVKSKVNSGSESQ